MKWCMSCDGVVVGTQAKHTLAWMGQKLLVERRGRVPFIYA